MGRACYVYNLLLRHAKHYMSQILKLLGSSTQSSLLNYPTPQVITRLQSTDVRYP